MTERFGDVGSGQITKMVNQICIVGAIQSVSEGLYFAKTAGLDAKKVAALVSQGAGGSWQLANRADTMIDNHFNHGFAVDWMRKDLGIALEQGKEMGLSLPVDGAGGPVLRRGSAAGRRALGHLQPDPALPPDARRRDLRRP